MTANDKEFISLPLGLHELLEFLKQQGVIAPPAEAPLTSAGKWLEFDSHLDRTLGCAPGSRSNYLLYARRFLEECFGHTRIEWQKLSADAVSIHRPGAHVLRHSLTTQMVVRGGTFKEIADVLGHQSLVITEIYAKLDLVSLSFPPDESRHPPRTWFA